MVSGLVTSPYDQLRIASGEASRIRIASKLLTSSTRPLSWRSAREKPPVDRESNWPELSNVAVRPAERLGATSGILALDMVPPREKTAGSAAWPTARTGHISEEADLVSC